MMTKLKSRKISLLKYVTVFPLLLSICFLFSSCQNEGKDDVVAVAPTQEIFKEVDKMPRFPGCEDVADKELQKECHQKEMLMFIYKNIKYPKEARDQGLQGTNVVQFVVEKDGSITNEKLVRGIGGGTDEECLRVVRLMPNWLPGMNNGKAVRVE